jgi:hypothetical protein
MATVILLNQPPKWFTDIVIYSFYTAMFSYIIYNVVQGFIQARHRAEFEEFKKRVNNLIKEIEEKGYEIKDVRWRDDKTIDVYCDSRNNSPVGTEEVK